jgi:class III poly(R)-hydroxyalkanoic acid synthase PhaE subunit
MNWVEYSEKMSNAWAEAQKILWETWADMFVTAPNTEAKSSVPGMIDLWKQFTQQNMGSWSAGAAPITKSTAEQFFSVQETSIRFLEFSARVWDAIGPKIKSGEDWSSALEESIEKFQDQWIELPQISIETFQDVNELWGLYIKQWQRFGQPWEIASQKTPEYLARMLSGDSSALIGLSNLYREAYQQSIARLVASPGLGMTREFNEKIQFGFDAWVSWQLATLEYQGVLSEIWDQAFDKFTENLLSLIEEDKQIESLRDLVLLWTRGAETVFTEAFRTENYVLAQGKMLNAAMTYRIREREIIEEYLKLYDLPTRSELDEAHRRIYELRKEVKALKKALNNITETQKGG